MTVFPDGTVPFFPHERYTDLTIYQFGHQYCKPNYTFGPFSWNHFIFHYILSGSGTLWSTDSKGKEKKYALSSGQGFLFWPGQTNTYSADAKNPWEYVWIEFDGLLAQEMVKQTGLDYNHPMYEANDIKERDKMANLMLKITKSINKPPGESIGYLYLFVECLVHSSSRRNITYKQSLASQHISRVINYINLHYNQDITIQDIAEHCRLDRSYLNRLINLSMSMTLQQFLISFRMKKACELLMTSEHSIGEISVMVGYPNQMNFSRTFKRELGLSPYQWRITRKE